MHVASACRNRRGPSPGKPVVSERWNKTVIGENGKGAPFGGVKLNLRSRCPVQDD